MPNIFAPHRIRAVSPGGAAVIIERGETKAMGRHLALDAIRQGGIDMAHLAEPPKLKPIDEVEAPPPEKPAKVQKDLDEMPNATAEQLAGHKEPETPAEPPPPPATVVAHPGDSDVVTAILEVIARNDPDELRSDGMPKSFAISKQIGRQIDSDERNAALEIVAKRLDR